MGNRKFYDQLIADTCQQEKDRITDETDVTTMKDYMQVWGMMQKVFLQLCVCSSWFFFLQINYYKAYSPPPPNLHSQPFVNILRHSASIVQPISNPWLKDVLLG